MKKTMITLMALGLFVAGALAQTPISSTISIATNATTVVWTVPAGAPGPLLSLQAAELGGTTATVKHLIPYQGGGVQTNTVGTISNTTAQAFWPVDAGEAVPVWLARGDRLSITLNQEPSAPAKIIVRTGKQ